MLEKFHWICSLYWKVKARFMKVNLFFIAVLILTGCTPLNQPEIQEPSIEIQERTETPEQRVHFLALGDSYTIGQGVPEKDRWPDQLALILNEKGFDIQVSMIARTGWTTNDLLEAMSRQSLLEEFDMVSLLIGVNDQYRGGKPEDYRPRFQALLEQAIKLAGDNPKKVIVLSIPDWEVTPFANQLSRSARPFSIDAFNKVNLDESQAYGVLYVDITPISRRVIEEKELLAPDGLHPSGIMYALWVQEMLPQVVEVIGNN